MVKHPCEAVMRHPSEAHANPPETELELLVHWIRGWGSILWQTRWGRYKSAQTPKLDMSPSHGLGPSRVNELALT